MLTYHPALWAPLLPEGGEFKILPTLGSAFSILNFRFFLSVPDIMSNLAVSTITKALTKQFIIKINENYSIS